MSKNKSTVSKLPDSKKSREQDRFRWDSVNGVTIDIPALRYQSPKRLREYITGLQADDVAEKLAAVSALADNARTRDLIDDLPLAEIERLTKAWGRQANKDLAGKSTPSSAS